MKFEKKSLFSDEKCTNSPFLNCTTRLLMDLVEWKLNLLKDPIELLQSGL